MQIALNPTSRNAPFEPHPRDYVTISEGTPYTVPANRIFVLTGIGTAGLADNVAPGLAELRADGVLEVMGGLYGCSLTDLQVSGWITPHTCTGAQVPPCISFAAGVVLAITGGGGAGDTRAWGYTAGT